jgi:hypothetical protein
MWLLLAIPFLTNVQLDFPGGLFVAGGWVLLAGTWLLLPLDHPACLRSPVGRRWYLGAALAGGIGLVLGVTDVGLRLRVAACEPWLATYALQVPAGGYRPREEPRRVGLFVVDRTEECDGVVALHTGGDLNRYGLAYNPQGKPLPPRHRVLRHLFGPWYTFAWKF